MRSHTKFYPDRFSRFDVYWIQTNTQINRQAKFIYRYKVYTIRLQKYWAEEIDLSHMKIFHGTIHPKKFLFTGEENLLSSRKLIIIQKSLFCSLPCKTNCSFQKIKFDVTYHYVRRVIFTLRSLLFPSPCRKISLTLQSSL